MKRAAHFAAVFLSKKKRAESMDKYRKRRAVAVAHEMVDCWRKRAISPITPRMWRARDKVLELIPKGASVGVGDQETDGHDQYPAQWGLSLFDRYKEGLPFSEVEEIYRQALLADVFLTSSNAITRQGQLVNIRASGATDRAKSSSLRASTRSSIRSTTR